VLASGKVKREIQLQGFEVRPHKNASECIMESQVMIDFSDGARFPSIAVASLSAGISVITKMSSLTIQTLGGAAYLVEECRDIPSILVELLSHPSWRAVQKVAGRDRAADFSAESIAYKYAALYRAIV
jgi:hypothetical protein